mmetsp:Transcript_6755/g.26116  ORF Transcript_6755/g.26116 Transcript_6755/m.26116 type:complete len:266 (-) Transcript_6755:394-1191(-)
MEGQDQCRVLSRIGLGRRRDPGDEPAHQGVAAERPVEGGSCQRRELVRIQEDRQPCLPGRHHRVSVPGRGSYCLEWKRQEDTQSAHDLPPSAAAAGAGHQRGQGELYSDLRSVQVQVPRLHRGSLRCVSLCLHDAPWKRHHQSGQPVCGGPDVVLPSASAVLRSRPREGGPQRPGRENRVVPQQRRSMPIDRPECKAAMGTLLQQRWRAGLHADDAERSRSELAVDAGLVQELHECGRAAPSVSQRARRIRSTPRGQRGSRRRGR